MDHFNAKCGSLHDRGAGDKRLAGGIGQEGHPLEEIEDGQRILPHDVATPMKIAPDGTLIPANANSTRPVTMVNYSAGIQKTRRFCFLAPRFRAFRPLGQLHQRSDLPEAASPVDTARSTILYRCIP